MELYRAVKRHPLAHFQEGNGNFTTDFSFRFFCWAGLFFLGRSLFFSMRLCPSWLLAGGLRASVVPGGFCVMCLSWYLCGGVVVILWWCLCGGASVVMFLWWMFLWWCGGVFNGYM